MILQLKKGGKYMNYAISIVFLLGLVVLIVIILVAVLAVSKKSQQRSAQSSQMYHMNNMQVADGRHAILEDIDRLTRLRESRVLTEEEYQEKKKILLEKL
jgi:flagellar biosynthesis/type III secretory pathway M-ring protein FliF/YscJ